MSYLVESMKGDFSTYTKGRFDSHLRNSNTRAVRKKIERFCPSEICAYAR